MTNWLTGSGGGKSGGGHTPVETPDSLHSKQLARIIEIVSEGEIEGLVDGLKSVTLNDTPVQNADGSYNFSGVKLIDFKGSLLQDYVPGFSESEAEHASDVGLPVKVSVASGPVTRTVQNRVSSGADAVRVTVGIPGLSIVNSSNGDINGASVQIKIEVQNNGGGFVTKITDTISGKTTSRYQRDYRISLPQSETGPWDIRVTRLTPDSTQSNVVDETWWDSYTIITESKMRFTNSAGFGIEVDSSNFSSIPRRGYHIRGLKIKIPSNYDPITRVYTGFWDGTFKLAWSNNPVWCYYDILTATRYGLGKYINPAMIDKWSLYSMAQYCDELVQDGFGGLEPRFTCNAYFQQRAEAFTFITNMASIFRAAAYGSAGGVALVQDSPKDPIAVFTAANTVGGEFTYSGTSIKARHTVVLVMWNDPEDGYRQKPEYVPDDEGIALYGVIQIEVVALGCTSRGQAYRFGKAYILAEKLEDEVVTFKVGLDSLKVYPGAMFQTSDPTRMMTRRGGRLIGSTLNSITIDAPIDLDSATEYTLKVMMPDLTIASRTISNPGMGITELQFTTPLSATPVNLAIWVIESVNKPLDSWVCLGIAEDDDGVSYTITGKTYAAEKFVQIDDGKPLPPTPVYNPYLRPAPPTQLNALVSLNQNGTRDIIISWSQPKGTRNAVLQWTSENNTSDQDQTTGSSFTIKNVGVGIYTIYVALINGIGISSLPSAIAVNTATGRSLAAPTNLTKTFREGLVVLTWFAVSDGPRLVLYEIRKGTNFVTALRLGTTTGTEFYIFGDGVYWVRAISADGEVQSAAVSITISGTEDFRNILATFDEHALGWPGSITSGGYIDGGYLKVLNGSTTYTIPVSHEVDVGVEQVCRCLVGYQIVGGSDVLFSTIPVVSEVTSFIGSYTDSVFGLVEIAIAGNDGVYGDWQEYHPGGYLGRKFKFRITVTSTTSDTPAVLSEFTTTVDVPDRVEVGANVAIPDTGDTITFNQPFHAVPGVQITIINAQTGDLVVLSTPTQDNFFVQIKNGGVGVARNINWSAQGY